MPINRQAAIGTSKTNMSAITASISAHNRNSTIVSGRDVPAAKRRIDETSTKINPVVTFKPKFCIDLWVLSEPLCDYPLIKRFE